MVYKIDYEPKTPGSNDSIHIYASAFDNDGLKEVSIYFQQDGSATNQIYPMNFSPIPNTEKVEESDRWVGTIPPLGSGQTGKFYIYVKDNQNQFESYPRKSAIEIKSKQTISNDILINEFMADNVSTIMDSVDEYDDWIELYNPTSTPITLTGRYLTDKTDNLTKYKFTQPDLNLNPNAYLLIWCDEQESQEGIHTNFKLSKSGEYIALVETDGISIIDSISFGPQQTDVSLGRYPDGSASWTFLQFPTPGSANTITSVENNYFTPNEFNLSAYPNPFNPSTTISFTIPERSEVSIIIYDILGNEVKRIFNQEVQAGSYQASWDATNNYSKNVSSGIYIVRINSNQQSKNLKLMLLK